MLRYSEAFRAVGSAEKFFVQFTGGQRTRLSELATTPLEKWSRDDVAFFEEVIGSLADGLEMKFIPRGGGE